MACEERNICFSSDGDYNQLCIAKVEYLSLSATATDVVGPPPEHDTIIVSILGLHAVERM